MKNKLLTIVIPVHNTDLTKLKRCLKSIPDHPDVFVDIYDDYTTEYSPELEIAKMIHEDSSLSHLYKEGNGFVRADVNLGLGAIRNAAVKRLYEESPLTNEFVMFLDSDDEVTLTSEDLDDLKYYSGDKNNKLISYGIDLISESGVCHESCKKYLEQFMFPYFVTPNLYRISFLYDNSIVFDESRMIFEDIMFTVKLWRILLTNSSHSIIFKKKNIYNYHLDGESLTRNDKKLKMADHLDHWVKWIQDDYNNIEDEISKIDMRAYYYNRIRYEKVKSLSLRMEANGDIEKYAELLNYLKPYKIDSVLPE